jgi:hypothetical protein
MKTSTISAASNLSLWLTLCLLGCSSWVSAGPPAQEHGAGRFLLVWAGDADRHDDDFMAIIDVRSDSSTFGHILGTVPVGSRDNEPHHIDLTLRGDGTVWASGVISGRTFIFDVSHPPEIKLLKVDEPNPERARTPPHIYAFLPNGHTIATAMDMRFHPRPGSEAGANHPHGDPAPGGLLEFDVKGNYIREISAGDVDSSEKSVSPYGMDIKPDVDRVLTTNAAHGWLPASKELEPGTSVQIWRMSDLKRLRTVSFAPGPRGDENVAPYEPRFAHAARSQTVFVNTAVGNSLYVSKDAAAPEPAFQLVYDFGKEAGVAFPAVTRDDHFFLQTLTEANKVVVLDIHDPMHPKPVSEVRFDRDPANPTRPRVGQPHYLTLDLDERRVAVSDYTLDMPAFVQDGDRRVYLLRFDPKTGQLSFDSRFRDELTGEVGIDFNRNVWPHGKTGAARPHGMLFLP